MGAAGAGDHLHGDDRQPAIRMDALRQSDARQDGMDERADPGRVLHLRADRDVARSRRGLADGQVRAAAGGAGRWRAGGPVVGAQLDGDLAGDALLRGRGRRCRRRLRVRHVRRQRAEMVSGQARPRRRPHGRGIRCRCRDHGRADFQRDPRQRLPERVLHVRRDPGPRRARGVAVPHPRATCRCSCARRCRASIRRRNATTAPAR